MQHSENIDIEFASLWSLLKLDSAYKLTESFGTLENIKSLVIPLLHEITLLQNIQSVIVNWILLYDMDIPMLELADAMEVISNELNMIPLEYHLTDFQRNEKNVTLQSIMVFK